LGDPIAIYLRRLMGKRSNSISRSSNIISNKWWM